MRDVLSIVRVGAVALFVCVVCGCGDGGPEGAANVKLVDGGGIVKYKGAPLAGASVTFIPKNGPVATGTTDLNGKFKLTTGAMAGVAVGDCKVTVSAYEAGGKPVVEGTPGVPGPPANPEDARARMADMAKKMQQNSSGPTNAGPKSIIPELYSKLDTTPLAQRVEADASKNQFTIELKD